MQTVARAVGQKLAVVAARNEAEIDAAFASFARERADALLVADDPFFTVHRRQIIALAARNRFPAIYYGAREYAADGGLITYGSSSRENYRQGGHLYVGRLLNGAKPRTCPSFQPTKFELVINLKVAKSLGVAVPPTLPRTRRRSDRIGEPAPAADVTE